MVTLNHNGLGIAQAIGPCWCDLYPDCYCVGIYHESPTSRLENVTDQGKHIVTKAIYKVKHRAVNHCQINKVNMLMVEVCGKRHVKIFFEKCWNRSFQNQHYSTEIFTSCSRTPLLFYFHRANISHYT